MEKAQIGHFFERYELPNGITGWVMPGEFLEDLTWKQLSKLAFVIMEKQKITKVPECYLATYAIEWLTNQCKEKNLSIF